MKKTIIITLMAVLASAPLWANNYINVTDFKVKANGKVDVADAIQKVIDEHPNSTIYFPDGTYLISKPICTPADPKKSVSLKLDNYAVIKATSDWNSDEAMIRLGGKDPYNDINIIGSNYGIEGGVIDGGVENHSERSVTGISIDSGRETTVKGVSIKHTQMGIHIKYGANYGSSDADIRDVNISGCEGRNSVGVLIEGHDNTLTNMRIASVYTGVQIKSGGNCLRNIHPLFIDAPNYIGSAAFRIECDKNTLIYCYNDQFNMGFDFTSSGASACVLDNCLNYWWYCGEGQPHTAIHVKGQFLGRVTNFTANFDKEEPVNSFLIEDEPGGCGTIENARVREELLDSKENDGLYKHVKGKILGWW